MAGKRPVVYWDTCVFLSWLTGRSDQAEVEGIEFWHDMIRKGEALIVTSAITFVELSPYKSKPEVYEECMRLVRLPNGRIHAVDWGVINEANRLRDLTMIRRDEGEPEKIICTPDAIHLATAAVTNCDEFHTFDKNGAGKCFGLLPFNGLLVGYKPRICKPARPEEDTPPEQRTFFDQPESTPLTQPEGTDGELPLSLPAKAGAETGDGEDRPALPRGGAEGDEGAPATEGQALPVGAGEAVKALPPEMSTVPGAVPLQLGAGDGPLIQSNEEPT